MLPRNFSSQASHGPIDMGFLLAMATFCPVLKEIFLKV